MKNKNAKRKLPDVQADNDGSGDPKDYPWYPVNEDIYVQDKEESDVDPEDVSHKKAPNERPGKRNEKNFNDDSGDDLDIPGSELDDEEEEIGSEDEENNYYSIGGDDHNDLEENYD